MWRLQSTASENFLVIQTNEILHYLLLLKPLSLALIVVFILSVCDVLPLVLKNMDMRLPTSLIQKYMLKAAEFYIGYVTRGPSSDVQIHGKAASS